MAPSFPGNDAQARNIAASFPGKTQLRPVPGSSERPAWPVVQQTGSPEKHPAPKAVELPTVKSLPGKPGSRISSSRFHSTISSRRDRKGSLCGCLFLEVHPCLIAARMMDRTSRWCLLCRCRRLAIPEDDHRWVLGKGIKGAYKSHLCSSLRNLLQGRLHVDSEVRLLRLLRIVGDRQLHAVRRCRNH